MFEKTRALLANLSWKLNPYANPWVDECTCGHNRWAHRGILNGKGAFNEGCSVCYMLREPACVRFQRKWLR